jgi:hypothetical protein
LPPGTKHTYDELAKKRKKVSYKHRPKHHIWVIGLFLKNTLCWKKPEKCFQGGKGAMAPQLWSAINFNRPEKGAVFLAPPNIWSRKDLSPIRNICGVMRHFAAFCGKLATTTSAFAAFYGMLRRVAAFCVILRHFAAGWR